MFADLMARVAAGDPEAARELHQRYGQRVRHAVRQRLPFKMRTRFDSHDFVQDVWAAFFTNPEAVERLREPDDLTAYLVRVAQNKVVDAVRQCVDGYKQSVIREESLETYLTTDEQEGLPAPGPTPSQVAIAAETWQKMLDGAPLVHRGILQMLREGHRPPEIAARLKLSEKTVRRVIHNTSAKLDT